MTFLRFVCLSFFLFAVSRTSNAAQPQTGMLEGIIVSRNIATNELTVQRGAVAGITGAMTITDEVRGQKVASLPQNGTRIMATLYESGGISWLTGVKPATKMPPMGGGAMAGMQMKMTTDATSDFLMRQASGTSMNPAAAPEHMTMAQRGNWMLMLHGLAFINQVFESGPRGANKLFSTNWLMGMASHPLGGGHLMFRSMLSLETLTVGNQYPELFQTGETINHRPIIDAQHPHDFFMELAAEYAHSLGEQTIGFIYVAPMGDPSLGPVAFPHRASASEIPQAALSHHLQDSTHIAGSVITIGAQRGMLGFGFSGFHGREPGENRWDIDSGRLDSWAARVTFDPNPNWTAQISTGHLEHPEAAEPGNIQRTTASVAYSKSLPQGHWDSSLIFGHNNKSQGHAASSWLAETVFQFLNRNYVTGRAEIVDRDELFAGLNVPPPIGDAVFRIKALTLGYARDVVTTGNLVAAIGGNVTAYAFPSALDPYYGRNPHSFYLFLRLRGRGSAMHTTMHSMPPM